MKFKEKISIDMIDPKVLPGSRYVIGVKAENDTKFEILVKYKS